MAQIELLAERLSRPSRHLLALLIDGAGMTQQRQRDGVRRAQHLLSLIPRRRVSYSTQLIDNLLHAHAGAQRQRRETTDGLQVRRIA